MTELTELTENNSFCIIYRNIQPLLLQACDENKHGLLVTVDEAGVAIANAVFAYEQRALKPLMDELPRGEKTYLLKMSESPDSDRLAETADIARRLDVSLNKTSRQMPERRTVC